MRACSRSTLLIASLVATLPAFIACNTLLIPVFDIFKPTYTAKAFVNWETPHVSPLALSSDGARLYAVNTPDARLEVFDVSGNSPQLVASIPVGLEPVSVRLRTDGEAWVVNHLSDSVSIVNLDSQSVIRTLLTADEPTDVAFTGDRAFVVCSQANAVQLFNLSDLTAAPTTIEIKGEDPRAAAVSPDGKHVYVTIFESGNHTTLISHEKVSEPDGPYGGVNPPPNVGTAYVPELNPTNPLPPDISVIVRKNIDGRWLDDNGGDWTDKVTWDLHDHDLAIIDTDSLAVRYTKRLMTTNMHLTARSDGSVIVVGTEALNHIRYEPNLTARFLHVVGAIVDPAAATMTTSFDLNPHLAEAYAAQLSSVSAELRDQSVADPRGVVASSDGSRLFVSGMGSENVAIFDAAGGRIGQVDVGSGPTGLALDESRNRLFVLNRFDASISVVDTASLTESSRTAFFDPTPAEVKAGRPFLYNARRFGGLGVTSCGSCHLDSRMDQLAWDLGDPSGKMKKLDAECNRPVLDFPAGDCEDFHPMKGPMTTQTLQNIIGTEPFHWRGDRKNLHEFNPAFVGLLGSDRELTDDEMNAFQAFLATIKFPPNPNRNLDNTLKTLVGDGNPQAGELLYYNQPIDLSVAKCNDCHNAFDNIAAGTNQKITSKALLVNHNQSIKVPQIRNIHEKSGFSYASMENNFGFGHNHDGVIDGMFNFFHIQNFTGFGDGEVGDTQRRDVISYVMSFATDTHAGVGTQLTLDGSHVDDPAAIDRFKLMKRLAAAGEVGLIACGKLGGEQRGFAYVGGETLRSDRASDAPISLDQLWSAATVGGEITFTIVPKGSETRLGIDRDEDGLLNADE
ncbi:MAG: YncE family protein [Phycisphaerae bacterium]